MALYNTIGHGYANFRQPDPRLAAAIDDALGDATSVANIGAGAGSYEPRNRQVIAVEPSEVMIRQRGPDAARCVQGSADAIPLQDASVDAAMAILSTHHWPDLEKGLREMARVARRCVVLLTWVPPTGNPVDPAPFWLTEDYFPEILAHDRTIFPTSAALLALLERIIGPARITRVPIPHDCIDGMLGAYWRRPTCYLEAARRAAISSFARIDAAPGLAKLQADVDSGVWSERNSHLLSRDSIDLGYRIVRCELRP